MLCATKTAQIGMPPCSSALHTDHRDGIGPYYILLGLYETAKRKKKVVLKGTYYEKLE